MPPLYAFRAPAHVRERIYRPLFPTARLDARAVAVAAPRAYVPAGAVTPVRARSRAVPILVRRQLKKKFPIELKIFVI